MIKEAMYITDRDQRNAAMDEVQKKLMKSLAKNTLIIWQT